MVAALDLGGSQRGARPGAHGPVGQRGPAMACGWSCTQSGTCTDMGRWVASNLYEFARSILVTQVSALKSLSYTSKLMPELSNGIDVHHIACDGIQRYDMKIVCVLRVLIINYYW